MMHKPLRRLVAATVCAAVMTLAPARVVGAGDTFKRSTELSKEASKTSEDVNRYVTQLDKTEKALYLVGQAPSKVLKKRYESFSKELTKLEAAQKHATADIDHMQSEGAEYFGAWDTSIGKISNPELQQASAERRSRTMKEFDDLTASLSDADSQLPVFMSELLDLKTFMETDLSAESVSKADGMILKSQSDSQALESELRTCK